MVLLLLWATSGLSSMWIFVLCYRCHVSVTNPTDMNEPRQLSQTIRCLKKKIFYHRVIEILHLLPQQAEIGASCLSSDPTKIKWDLKSMISFRKCRWKSNCIWGLFAFCHFWMTTYKVARQIRENEWIKKHLENHRSLSENIGKVKYSGKLN